jgi:hypothetical protein
MMNNNRLLWAQNYVLWQIKHFTDLGYFNFHVETHTKELILYNKSDEYHKLAKLMRKIIKELTFEDEKKQYAIRKVCNDIIKLLH